MENIKQVFPLIMLSATIILLIVISIKGIIKTKKKRKNIEDNQD
jgi:hypothetical protein